MLSDEPFDFSAREFFVPKKRYGRVSWTADERVEPEVGSSPEHSKILDYAAASLKSDRLVGVNWSEKNRLLVNAAERENEIWSTKLSCDIKKVAWAEDGFRFITGGRDGKIRLWSRHHPEYWWGIAWLPEFWIAYFSGGALLVIASRNLRRRFAKSMESLPAGPA